VRFRGGLNVKTTKTLYVYRDHRLSETCGFYLSEKSSEWLYSETCGERSKTVYANPVATVEVPNTPPGEKE